MESGEAKEAREQLESSAKSLSEVMISQLPEGVGFVLILADFGDEGNMAYMANIERGGVLDLLDDIRVKVGGN